MAKVKTSELIGSALDWVVAKCEGWIKGDITNPKFCQLWKNQVRTPAYYPSTNWAQGGPIIEREKIDVQYDKDRVFDPDEKIERWFAGKPFEAIPDECWGEYGPTPLIAAMRCYVTSKLGDEVEVPDELL